MINEDVLDNVRPDHAVNSMEQGVGIVLVLAGMEVVVFIAAFLVLYVLDL